MWVSDGSLLLGIKIPGLSSFQPFATKNLLDYFTPAAMADLCTK